MPAQHRRLRQRVDVQVGRVQNLESAFEAGEYVTSEIGRGEREVTSISKLRKKRRPDVAPANRHREHMTDVVHSRLSAGERRRPCGIGPRNRCHGVPVERAIFDPGSGEWHDVGVFDALRTQRVGGDDQYAFGSVAEVRSCRSYGYDRGENAGGHGKLLRERPRVSEHAKRRHRHGTDEKCYRNRVQHVRSDTVRQHALQRGARAA